MRPRDILSWKFLFYHVLLPALRWLGPAWCDAVLSGLGRAVGALWLPRRWEHLAALKRVQHALGAEWSPEALRPELAAATARFLARAYPLEGISDAEHFRRSWRSSGSSAPALRCGTGWPST